VRVECIRAFGNAAVGEVVDGLPDDAAVDPEHWRILPAAAVKSPVPSPAAVGAPVPPVIKEGM